MLDFRQVQTAAYLTDCELICPDCAEGEYGAFTIARLDEGLPNRADGELRPLIRYEVDEWNSSNASDAESYGYFICGAEDGPWWIENDYADLVDGPFDTEYEAEDAIWELVRERCAHCGSEL